MINLVKKYAPTFLIVVAASVVAVWSSSLNKNPEPVRPELDRSVWKTFLDKDFGFEFRYPPTMAAQKSGSRIQLYGTETRVMEAEVVEEPLSEVEEFKYLGFGKSGMVQVGEKGFGEYKAPNGFCDRGKCGRPFSAYAYKLPKVMIVFVFYGNDILSPEERAILATLVNK
jgi:hypothetical protein